MVASCQGETSFNVGACTRFKGSLDAEDWGRRHRITMPRGQSLAKNTCFLAKLPGTDVIKMSLVHAATYTW
jgi:hypothetical protein